MIRSCILFCLLLIVESIPSHGFIKKIGNLTIDDAIRDVGDQVCGRSHGPWSSLLEDWATGDSDRRQERIMKLPNTQGYYISNRVDNPPSVWSDESNPGKVANRPQYNYPKQKPSQLQQPQYTPITNPARKEVTETDLYLLGAIEKLVYRVDFMEKRLRKAEELIYYLSAGIKKNPDPCSESFVRAGVNCYKFITNKESNWKTASSSCKDMGATLAEMETIEENQDVVTFIQATNQLKGKDFWTGGLNPGLLWIWSNSARPVSNGDKNETQILGNGTKQQENPMKIKGNGRCLKLAYNPTIRSYSYMGHDCASQHYFICEKIDKGLSNEIQKISRSLNL